MRTRTRGSPSWPTAMRRKAGYVFADCSDHPIQTACRRGGPYVSARCRYVGADCGAVDAVVAAVRHHLGQRDRHGFPDPSLAPTSKPAIDRVPTAVLGGTSRHGAPDRSRQRMLLTTARLRSGRLPRPGLSGSIGNRPFSTRSLCLCKIAPAQGCLPKSSLESILSDRVKPHALFAAICPNPTLCAHLISGQFLRDVFKLDCRKTGQGRHFPVEEPLVRDRMKHQTPDAQ